MMLWTFGWPYRSGGNNVSMSATRLATRARASGPRALDLTILALGAPLWVPTLALVATVIRIVDGPPIFFRQLRAGVDAVPFSILKFRTMVPEADSLLDEHGRPTVARNTRTGRGLRRFGLDELPQLVNVLQGQMSLVGPRPVLPEWVDKIPGGSFHPRFRVPPGLTGPAQVAGRNLVPWSHRIRLDAEYARSRSVSTNLRWLVLTPAALLQPTVSADRNAEDVDDLEPGHG